MLAQSLVFRQLCELPTEANLWWQLALNAFNSRRDHMTAVAAFAIVATLSKAVRALAGDPATHAHAHMHTHVHMHMRT